MNGRRVVVMNLDDALDAFPDLHFELAASRREGYEVAAPAPGQFLHEAAVLPRAVDGIAIIGVDAAGHAVGNLILIGEPGTR